jgi:hypothetical protein
MSESGQNSRIQFLVVWVIWAALLGAVVLYGVLGLHIKPSQADVSTGTRLPLVFTVMGILMLSATWLIRQFAITAPLQEGRLNLRDSGHFGRYLTAQIVVFALCEAVSILGLVQRFAMGLSREGFLAFVGAGFLALVIHAPLQARLDESVPR